MLKKVYVIIIKIQFVLNMIHLVTTHFRIWSVGDNTLLAKTEMENGVRSVAFSSDGSHLAVGMADGSFKVLTTR